MGTTARQALGAATPATQAPRIAALVHRLRELGWIENRTVAIEFRWADGRTERYSEIAEEFVRLKIDVIVTTGTPIETTSEQGAIHGRGYNSRVRFGEACFPGARD